MLTSNKEARCFSVSIRWKINDYSVRYSANTASAVNKQLQESCLFTANSLEFSFRAERNDESWSAIWEKFSSTTNWIDSTICRLDFPLWAQWLLIICFIKQTTSEYYLSQDKYKVQSRLENFEAFTVLEGEKIALKLSELWQSQKATTRQEKY